MTTFFPFQPTINNNYVFQPTLDTNQYTCELVWSLFGRRWVLTVYTLQGVLVLQKPLRGSPDGYDINLIAGYFGSTLVFRASTNTFEVNP